MTGILGEGFEKKVQMLLREKPKTKKAAQNEKYKSSINAILREMSKKQEPSETHRIVRTGNFEIVYYFIDILIF